MMQWQHGSYNVLSNGSLQLTPIAEDGRQLMSDPCNFKTSIYTAYNQSELMQVCELKRDAITMLSQMLRVLVVRSSARSISQDHASESVPIRWLSFAADVSSVCNTSNVSNFRATSHQSVEQATSTTEYHLSGKRHRELVAREGRYFRIVGCWLYNPWGCTLHHVFKNARGLAAS